MGRWVESGGIMLAVLAALVSVLQVFDDHQSDVWEPFLTDDD